MNYVETAEHARREFQSGSKSALSARDYLDRRGISPVTAEHFELGVTQDRSPAGHLTIPLHDDAGCPAGLTLQAMRSAARCRACSEPVTAAEMSRRRYDYRRTAQQTGLTPPDWRSCPRCGAANNQARLAWLPGQFPLFLRVPTCVPATEILYNRHRTRPRLRDRGVMVVCEGYSDTWAFHEAGIEACAHLGAKMSDQQAAAVVDDADVAGACILLCADADQTGLTASRMNVHLLREQGATTTIIVVRDYDGEKDPAKYLERHGPKALSRLVERRLQAGRG